MLIKYVRSRRRNKPGDVADFPDGAANLLIKRGFCIREQVPEAAVSMAAMEAETAANRVRRRR